MLDTLRDEARACLPADIWAHLQQGAHDDTAPRPSVFDEVPLTPRPLRQLGHGHTGITLLDESLAHPFLVAPLAYGRLFHPDGDAGLAMAASAQGGQSLLSSLASQPITDIVAAHRHGKADGAAHADAPWFQLYWQGSRVATARLMDQALQAGCPVVVFTVDAPVKTAGLVLPQGVQAVNLTPSPEPAPTSGQVFTHWMAQAPTWDDIRWLRLRCPVPLLIKGILHPDDALAAIALGCDGLVISTHGGRVLNGCISPLQALRQIAPRVAHRIPLLLDSGIRSGRDAFVALQAGASAVLVGRPCLWGLSARGALGVAQVLRMLRDELEMTMALMGCATIAECRASAQPSLGRSLGA